ncbi:unnamed protein product [Durusdinium trenchii]|uniref:Uncharacterized protein n=1 Tax=Durusdinium trenchii TaxID=1381693 RepID=A0ABP0NJN8_9DINO
MTTGSWFVAFGSSELEEALENAEETLREAYVIPAAVKLQDSNPFVPTFIWRRPVALLFAKHQLYRYHGPKIAEELVAFAEKALNGEMQGEQIPPEVSFLGKLWQRFMGQGEL